MPPAYRNDQTQSRSRKRRVYQEEAKTRQTSHWDWDYLPLETLERLARDSPAHPPEAPRPSVPAVRRKLALLCIAAGALSVAGLLLLLFLFYPRPV